ncbi:hypothetical protein EJ077_09680 [Mesorhizobium sp. M8A.F.Ca.ET.057.01.1.1]|nr:hypothetical protein EJ077_09680 [Mesorhizobium sp. M8A.F.Ca.ET.057.01.1.1]RWE46061.1 MAG: hypothetical protein EOS80_15780 [Mesorhizobium sp.]
MRIAILGAGMIGGTVGRLWAQLGRCGLRSASHGSVQRLNREIVPTDCFCTFHDGFSRMMAAVTG